MPSSSCTQFVGFKKRCHDNCRECPALDVHDFKKCRIKTLLLSATFSAIVLYGKILNNMFSYSILEGIIFYFKDQLKITKPRHFTSIFSKSF